MSMQIINKEVEGDGSGDPPLEDLTQLKIENIPAELQTDSEWEDTFETQPPPAAPQSQTTCQ